MLEWVVNWAPVLMGAAAEDVSAQSGWWLTLIPAAPLFAAVWIALLHQWQGRTQAHWPCIIGVGVSAIASLYLLVMVVPQGFSDHGSTAVSTVLYDWIKVGQVDIPIRLRADAMTALMLVMVTGVSTLVAVFASGYMKGDPGYPRFFAAISLFVFSMCMLVLAGNFLLLFVFWEAVGLCSYLLIGFWFHKPSAAAAAKKAFVVNRIGDFGLMSGIFFLWTTFGTLDFDGILSAGDIIAANPERMTLICLLLFVGAVGKSAQFPLHVWLPDAMEGPTPVSALIHAATMVTAGVYLVARCTPLFAAAPMAQMVVSGIGAATALIAAVTALTQYDLKRVLAYSTVSQLGYMFMALGAGAGDSHLVTHAVTFALFHMFTHAFFKAVLFLSAGSVMHAMGDVIDMRQFRGLRRVMPVTHFAFLSGSLALAGFPLLSGFWSKDEILSVLAAASQSPERGMFFQVILALALLTALLTAFYTFRAYFLTFWGDEKFPEHVHHPHDASTEMAIPLVILAVCALGIGLVTGPTHLYGHYLHQTPGLPHAEPHGLNFLMMGLSILLALAGMAGAYVMYGTSPDSARIAEDEIGGLRSVSYRGFYLDAIYNMLLVKPVELIADLAQQFDRFLLDKVVDGVGLAPGLVATVFRPLQNGRAQSYAAVMLIMVVGALALMLSELSK